MPLNVQHFYLAFRKLFIQDVHLILIDMLHIIQFLFIACLRLEQVLVANNYATYLFLGL